MTPTIKGKTRAAIEKLHFVRCKDSIEVWENIYIGFREKQMKAYVTWFKRPYVVVGEPHFLTSAASYMTLSFHDISCFVSGDKT